MEKQANLVLFIPFLNGVPLQTVQETEESLLRLERNFSFGKPLQNWPIMPFYANYLGISVNLPDWGAVPALR